MASAWAEEESFMCSVCLETLKDPATLPCGHSYCLACIKNHWDKRDSKGQYSCPQCRQVFNPRPSLAKSTLLVEAMEKLRTNSLKATAASTASPSMPVYLEVLPDVKQRPGSMYPQLPTVDPRSCPKHNKPLDLFCQEDKECVCEVCCLHEHEGHSVVKPENERKHRQKELDEMHAEVHTRIKKTERKLKEIPHAARQHKALVQALERESKDLFSDLVMNMNDTNGQFGELIRTHESELGSQVEGQLHRLEQEVAQLHWKSEELTRVTDVQDHICFLKNFFTLSPLGQTSASGDSVLDQEAAVVASIRSIMKELQEGIQGLCNESLHKITKLLNQDSTASASNGVQTVSRPQADQSCQAPLQNTVYETITDHPPTPPARPKEPEPSKPMRPSSFQGASAPPLPIPPLHPRAYSVSAVGVVNPEPKTREEMLKFRFEATMDPNTAYRHVQLSDGGCKATLRAENNNLPDHPERFQFWRQVLCKQPLGGSPYYWEVEWTGQKVTIGVTYKEIERKGSDEKSRLGHNAHSWSLYWSGSGFSFWHNGQEKLLGSPKARRIGIYLDQQMGILAFYSITNNKANLIHRHLTQFSGPLYPGFRFWSGAGSAVTICQLD
ncbi:unnamed protein product [Ophioblennius macclurei]